jgi:hypothetical protein
MSSYFQRLCRFQSCNVFTFLLVLACLGAEFILQSVREERNAYRCSLFWLVQCGTTGRCTLFCCKDFFATVLNFRFMLMSIYKSTVQSTACPSNNMR